MIKTVTVEKTVERTMPPSTVMIVMTETVQQQPVLVPPTIPVITDAILQPKPTTATIIQPTATNSTLKTTTSQNKLKSGLLSLKTKAMSKANDWFMDENDKPIEEDNNGGGVAIPLSTAAAPNTSTTVVPDMADLSPLVTPTSPLPTTNNTQAQVVNVHVQTVTRTQMRTRTVKAHAKRQRCRLVTVTRTRTDLKTSHATVTRTVKTVTRVMTRTGRVKKTGKVGHQETTTMNGPTSVSITDQTGPGADDDKKMEEDLGI